MTDRLQLEVAGNVLTLEGVNHLQLEVIPPSQVEQVWNLRHDLDESVSQTWNLRHDLSSAITQTWNLRHDLSSSIEQIWNLRHDLSSTITQTWNLRYDLLTSVETVWNLRHDLESAVSNTWTLRHDMASQVEIIWNIRHDLAAQIERIWNLRHDLLSSISQLWTFRHDLLEDEVVVENPVRGFKKANRPKFYIPLEKELTVKFRIPIFWVNKLDIKLDLPVWYQIIYEKRLTTYHIKDENIKIPTSITQNIKAKLGTFVESIQNISLKPDFRLEKLKNLSKLQKILRESSLNE